MNDLEKNKIDTGIKTFKYKGRVCVVKETGVLKIDLKELCYQKMVLKLILLILILAI